VRFRAIRIGVKEMGNREHALDEAQRILERARRGEDFEKLSEEKNHDSIRKANKGWWLMEEVKGDDGATIGKQPRWVEPGSLRLDQIEKAAFAMQVGDVSSAPIDVGDGFYILKLEARQNGRVRPFDEPDVQAQIRRVLSADQRRVLRDKEYQKLAKQSVVREDPEKIQTAVDMAMQKYFAWSRANGLTRANPDQVGGTSR
jgi:parvulin-like peptidyl-prolyl isomerase